MYILRSRVYVEFQSPLKYQMRTTGQLICIRRRPENSIKGKAESQSWNNGKYNKGKNKISHL